MLNFFSELDINKMKTNNIMKNTTFKTIDFSALNEHYNMKAISSTHNTITVNRQLGDGSPSSLQQLLINKNKYGDNEINKIKFIYVYVYYTYSGTGGYTGKCTKYRVSKSGIVNIYKI